MSLESGWMAQGIQVSEGIPDGYCSLLQCGMRDTKPLGPPAHTEILTAATLSAVRELCKIWKIALVWFVQKIVKNPNGYHGTTNPTIVHRQLLSDSFMRLIHTQTACREQPTLLVFTDSFCLIHSWDWYVPNSHQGTTNTTRTQEQHLSNSFMRLIQTQTAIRGRQTLLQFEASFCLIHSKIDTGTDRKHCWCNGIQEAQHSAGMKILLLHRIPWRIPFCIVSGKISQFRSLWRKTRNFVGKWEKSWWSNQFESILVDDKYVKLQKRSKSKASENHISHILKITQLMPSSMLNLMKWCLFSRKRKRLP